MPEYRIRDLALRLGKSQLTIKRWESSGVIPPARRDANGWRVYSEDEVRNLIKMVQERKVRNASGGDLRVK